MGLRGTPHPYARSGSLSAVVSRRNGPFHAPAVECFPRSGDRRAALRPARPLSPRRPAETLAGSTEHARRALLAPTVRADLSEERQRVPARASISRHRWHRGASGYARSPSSCVRRRPALRTMPTSNSGTSRAVLRRCKQRRRAIRFVRIVHSVLQAGRSAFCGAARGFGPSAANSGQPLS
jgi:hypothetical protein